MCAHVWAGGDLTIDIANLLAGDIDFESHTICVYKKTNLHKSTKHHRASPFSRMRSGERLLLLSMNI